MPSEITFTEFGGPDVLHWTSDAELPEPLPSQIVVVVAAASVLTLDARIRSGDLRDTVTTLLPSGIGRDVAGVVIARGRSVTAVGVGDEVLGFADTGAYAQFAAMSTFVPKPHSLPWAVAASLPTASEAAHRGLAALNLVKGETLLVTGGAGAVGSIAVQTAIARGITVIATVGSADAAYLRSLGAVAVRYGTGWSDRVKAAAPLGIDAAFDTAGRRLLPEIVAVIGSPDRVVTIADNAASIYGVTMSLASAFVRSTALLTEVTADATAGVLSVRIARTYPLAKAAKAHRDLAVGRTKGRLVLVNGA
ncbi:MAG: Quinone oxidoreductase [Glaciihabitans sp.]|nr:Quinone oxidoreductase [Glaciihabitans sp.]